MYYQWADVIPDFEMPLDISINGIEQRIYPASSVQALGIPELSVLIIKDWEFLITLKENPQLADMSR